MAADHVSENALYPPVGYNLFPNSVAQLATLI